MQAIAFLEPSSSLQYHTKEGDSKVSRPLFCREWCGVPWWVSSPSTAGCAISAYFAHPHVLQHFWMREIGQLCASPRARRESAFPFRAIATEKFISNRASALPRTPGPSQCQAHKAPPHRAGKSTGLRWCPPRNSRWAPRSPFLLIVPVRGLRLPCRL